MEEIDLSPPPTLLLSDLNSTDLPETVSQGWQQGLGSE